MTMEKILWNQRESGPKDMILYTMWSSVDIKMDHTLVNSSSTNYMYNVLIEITCVEFAAPFMADIFNQKRLMLNGVDVDISL